jgi:hypothetical protein
MNLLVDLDEATGFLRLLDPGARYFTFQAFDDDAERKDEVLAKVLNGTLAQHDSQLISLNGNGAGVFITINETDGRGRKAKNIERVRTVFVDLDGAPLELVLRGQLKPHIVVETSPGKFHCYWRVVGMALEQFTAVQLAIAERFNGDPGVSDLPRVMRLPGFWHQKAAAFKVRIVSTHDGPPYPESCFERREVEPHISGRRDDEVTSRDLLLAAAALEIIPPADKWPERNYIGMTIFSATGGHNIGFEAWCRWLQKSGRYSEHHAGKQWRGYCKYRPNRLGLGTLIRFADLTDSDWCEKIFADLGVWGSVNS